MPEKAVTGRQRISTRIRRIGLVCLAVAVYGGVLWYVGWERIGTALSEVDLRWLAPMVFLEISGLWLRAGKWRYALGPGMGSMNLFFLSKAAGMWTPGRLGELSPLFLPRYRSHKVASWIIVDRGTEAACTMGLGLAGVALLGLVPLRWLIGLTAGFCIWASFGYYMVFIRKLAHKDSVSTHAPTTLMQRLRRLDLLMRTEIRALHGKLPVVIFATLGLTFTDMLAATFLFRGFGYPIEWPLMAAARCAHAIVAALPFAPDASGLPYLTQAALLHREASVPPATLAAALALEMAILYGIFWVSFGLGAGVLLRHGGKAAPAAEPQADR